MLSLSPDFLISAIITLLVSLTIHEFSHAWVASRLGDDTPRRYGRLTLNPMAHLDPIGSLMLVIAGFGWAKPVPVDMYSLRRASKAGPMLVSLAGPFSNFLLAFLAAVPLRLNLVPLQIQSTNILPTPYTFLIYFLTLNLGLMLFNLLPIPPLDGNEILRYFLPPQWAAAWDNLRPYGMYILFALLMLGPLVGFSLVQTVLSPLIRTLQNLLLG
jgi:Zn-dependent protease